MKFKLTAHVVERYVERTGCKSFQKAMNRVQAYVDNAVRIGDAPKGEHWYAGGFIFVVSPDGFVVTMFRPQTHRQLLAVHNSCVRSFPEKARRA